MCIRDSATTTLIINKAGAKTKDGEETKRRSLRLIDRHVWAKGLVISQDKYKEVIQKILDKRTASDVSEEIKILISNKEIVHRRLLDTLLELKNLPPTDGAGPTVEKNDEKIEDDTASRINEFLEEQDGKGGEEAAVGALPWWSQLVSLLPFA